MKIKRMKVKIKQKMKTKKMARKMAKKKIKKRRKKMTILKKQQDETEEEVEKRGGGGAEKKRNLPQKNHINPSECAGRRSRRSLAGGSARFLSASGGSRGAGVVSAAESSAPVAAVRTEDDEGDARQDAHRSTRHIRAVPFTRKLPSGLFFLE
ncbi:unnamed protein product [Pleuronectes platessa]|uniref:Uncharacterized protein n=1 Tax=Pleuronectes platessa TaxID=8262 RepID=A0A9N7UD39_PLEPL|nr:unnamed protein product [Pleuronectes platessa]